MARQLTPEELEALLGAYALGAVDDEERAQVEAYVAEHPPAAEELEQLAVDCARCVAGSS